MQKIVTTSLAALLWITIPLQAQDIDNASPPSASLTLKKLSIEELMNVEVTSVSRRPEKLTEVASAIQVITNEDIRRSGATSVPEALRLATNLQVAQVNASQWAISSRGFNNVLANKLLVMIDGRTVYTPLYAGVFWDVQNLLLEDIERIEVVSGPGGTLWGANAVNGVINIITKSAQHTQGAFVEGGIGTEFRGYGGVRYGGKIADDVYYRVYGTAFKKGSTLDSEGNDANDEWTMAQGGLQLDWEQEKNQLTLQSNFYDNRPNPDGATAIEASGQNILGRWNHTLSSGSDFKIQLYFDRTMRDFRNGFAQRLNTYDFDGHHRFALGSRNQVVWGLGYRLIDDDVQNIELLRFQPGEKTLHVYNLFLQDKISVIKDRLDITIGAKLEHNSYTNWQFQPSARLAFTLADGQTLWSAVSRAVRNPSRIDRDFVLYAAPGVSVLQGSNDFKSEEVMAYELGWRLRSLSTFALSVATFYNVYDNLRSAEPGPPPLNLPITLANGVEGKTYGGELKGTYQPFKWWQLAGGFTLLKKELSIKKTSRDLNGGRVESNDPEYQFLVQSLMDLPKRFELGLTLRHVDALPQPSVSSYWGLDARIAWKATDMIEFDVVAQNLLHDEQVEFIPSSPPARRVQHGIYGKIVCRF